MSNQVIHDPLDFSQILRLLETTDLAHADTFNPLFERLINNDLFMSAFMLALAGEGRTVETVKGNAVAISETQQSLATHQAETVQYRINQKRRMIMGVRY